uniref:Macaca fascicularis brain cDNA clone: QflA-16703, similar to human LIM domain binding 2 (LDB2), mRNA, RefSeq: NM_001290.1 n=1 Tax=Macaca fascicularis TaxID=9541 RepID=I7GL25_MACFA|nr:unnamed protein product [Macaca fascicularis]
MFSFIGQQLRGPSKVIYGRADVNWFLSLESTQ